MSKKQVTLKAVLGKGVFYWVCEVKADTDEEAIVAAEHLFLSETSDNDDWQFNEFDVQPIDKSGQK